MTEFPPNLDDGEHWLPSDIFPDEVPSPRRNLTCMPQFPTYCSSNFTCMAMDQPQICQHFATYPPASPSLELERLRPPSRFSAVAQPGKVSISGNRNHAFSYESRSLHMCSVLQTLQSPYGRVQSYIEIRTRQLQMQQHQFPPFPSAGVGHGGLGRTPQGQGTGVFLPRAAPSSTTLNPTRARVNPRASKKQAGGKNRQEGQASPISQRKSMSSFGLGQSADFHYQLSPPDMGLPQEWTY